MRADRNDLRMEADRQNYRLQLRNQPFERIAQDAIGEVDAATLYQERDPGALAKCRAMLQTQCDGVAKPELDPGLYRNGGHPAMLKYITMSVSCVRMCMMTSRVRLYRCAGQLC